MGTTHPNGSTQKTDGGCQWSIFWERLSRAADVVDECSDGDPVAVQDRLAYLDGIPLLQVPDDVNSLAESLIAGVPLPENAAIDAVHIAVAVVNGIEYLLTWNCKHIANPSTRPRIERLCREMGYEPPVICTPQELLEINDAN